ncbi:MAG: crotonase/enoyl-CoA hydratase family protein [Halieaceae bacterium]|jgi:enoyl-CoA hydratase|nr:crotonase/enoyl-CoA hydratase family protein [Halieaceae bacterium]
MPELLFEKRGHVAWITINRPDAKNTLNAGAFVALDEAWQEVAADDQIRCAVVTASGQHDFCCGGDLSAVIPLWTGQRQPQNAVEEKLLADPALVDRVMLKNVEFYKPVIAAINGRALGGGCELIQATDIRIAAEHAQFGLPESKVGLVPGAGSMVRLPRQIPYTQAMKILLTGEPIDSRTALSIGLISDVVAATDLLDEAERVAERVARNAPLALQAIKKTALATHTISWADAFRVEASEAARVMMSRDAREGPKAFKDRREPEFIGN